MSIRMNKMTCCQVLISDKFTVFSPAWVIADTVKKRLSMKGTLRAGVEEPQNMMAETRHIAI
jgi:hypothetical protein